ncbi:MAG TPA: methylaspartate mutase [Clostridiales bacterium]|nr:methylaspartate mutase [Clostridiales bacterium]
MAGAGPQPDPTERPNSILGLDCGSTTTKAALYARDAGGRLALVGRRDSPTTVEAPFEDVAVGVKEAVAALEEATGWTLLDPGGDGFLKPQSGPCRGIDAVVATSSAGGGLRVLVAGVIRSMTAESAERAALGAGAIVSEVIAIDDGRRPHEKLELIRQVEPDMILLAGGVDGGNVSHVVHLAELLFTAGPRARFAGEGPGRLPIVFAGNQDARAQVREILGSESLFSSVPNIRPRLESEDVLPARLEIQDLFMKHVMAHAPNYRRLASWVETIIPTPAAVGRTVEMVAQSLGDPVLAVDVGGATTDVFSVHDGVLYRSVAAGIGLSYGALNLLAQTGAANVWRWLVAPSWSETQFSDAVGNKAIRPTTLPETPEELELEQALAREALRLSWARHIEIVVGLKGVHQERDLGNVFDQPPTGLPLVSLRRLRAVVGSGGVLSHAPEPWQVAAILIDGLEPEGMTRLFFDRGFLFPNVGAMAGVSPEAAREILFGEALVPLGTVVSPVLHGARPGAAAGRPCLKAAFTPPGESTQEFNLAWGELRILPLPAGCRARLELYPTWPGTDLGGGPGETWRGMVDGGAVGLILDTRGRPLRWPGERRASRASDGGGPDPRPDPPGLWVDAVRRAGLGPTTKGAGAL